MGMIPNPTDIIFPKKRLVEALTIVFPVCKQGLEIECGDGDRIRVLRRRHQNIWGINSEDLSEKWKENGVDPYCRHILPTDIHYVEDSFDVVMWNGMISGYTDDELDKILNHIKRICSYRVYMVCEHTDNRDLKFWVRRFKKALLQIDCIHPDKYNNYVVEALCI